MYWPYTVQIQYIGTHKQRPESSNIILYKYVKCISYLYLMYKKYTKY